MNKQGKFSLVKKQGGFTITELMLVLGVGAVIIAGAFIGYKTVSENNDDQQNMSATVNLLASTKNKWSGIGSFNEVTSAAVNQAGLVVKPLTWNGTDINNVYSMPIKFLGVASNFVAQIKVPPQKCIETVGSLDGIAYRIDVHTAGVPPSDTAASQAVKPAGETIDALKVATQCGATTTIVTAFVK